MDNKQLTDFAVTIVEKNVDKICNKICGVGKDVINTAKIQCGSAFTSYLQNSIDKYSKTKTILYKNTPVNLYDFYVHNDLQNGEEKVDTSDVNNVLDISRFVIITGTGGTGKTTLLKHLFLNTIEKTNKIPVFIELRNLNDTTDTLTEFIYKTVSNLNIKFEMEFFSRSLEIGCYVFYFDAFDEVNENRRISLAKEIINISDKYNNNYYVISSRQKDENDEFIGWSRFTELSTLPLDKEKALKLIKNLNYNSKSKEIFLKQLDDNLYENYYSFASNPLLLTIMLMTFDQYAKIPEKIHLFYAQAFDTLYSKHDATKSGYVREMKTNLPLDDFKKILSTFCTLTYLDNKMSFRNDVLLDYFNTVKELEDIEFNIKNYKDDLLASVCILMFDGIEYKYTHRSFQEYFTATYISMLSDKEQKCILKKIFREAPNRLIIDSVFDMLFDINRDALESNFIIPILNEVKTKTLSESERESNIKFLNLMFNSIYIDINPKDGKSTILFGILNDDNKYLCFTRYIRRRYNIVMPKELSNVDQDGDLIKQLLDKTSFKFSSNGEKTFEFKDLDINDEIYDYILKLTPRFTYDYKHMLYLLTELEKKQLKKQSAKKLLFKLKKRV